MVTVNCKWPKEGRERESCRERREPNAMRHVVFDHRYLEKDNIKFSIQHHFYIVRCCQTNEHLCSHFVACKSIKLYIYICIFKWNHNIVLHWYFLLLAFHWYIYLTSFLSSSSTTLFSDSFRALCSHSIHIVCVCCTAIDSALIIWYQNWMAFYIYVSILVYINCYAWIVRIFCHSDHSSGNIRKFWYWYRNFFLTFFFFQC